MTARKDPKDHQRPGPKVKGPPWETVAFCMRKPLRDQIEAAAEAEGVKVSCWLRWAARNVLARGWKMGPAAKAPGDAG